MKDYASFPMFVLVAGLAAAGTYAFLTFDDPIWRAISGGAAVLNFLLAIWESGKDRR